MQQIKCYNLQAINDEIYDSLKDPNPTTYWIRIRASNYPVSSKKMYRLY